MPSYGPLISFHDAEAALVEHIKVWIDAYLAGREEVVGVDYNTFARPASWFVKQTFTALPGEDRTPAVIVVSNGFSEPPQRRGDGTYDVYLRLAVAGLAHAVEAEYARELAGHYQAALLGICLQQKKLLGGRMKLNDFEDLGLDDVDEDQTRTLCAARLEFVYQVQDFASEFGGPKTVPAPPTPLPGDPTVQTVDIDTQELP